MAKLVLKVFKKPFRVWKPGTDIVSEILKAYDEILLSGDFIVLSDKAVSVAKGLVYDESIIKPSILTKLATYLVMRVLWGKILSFTLKEANVSWIKTLDLNTLARHKQLALRVGGFLQVLKPMSEGGIDTSNLPGTIVSIPVKSPGKLAKMISLKIFNATGKKVNVLIVDSDRCYLVKGLRIALASRPTDVKGLVNMGFISYLTARFFRKFFKPMATPTGYYGRLVDLETLLKISEISDRVRGFGAGRTVFEVAERFNVGVEEVTWSHLEKIPHYPVILVRLARIRSKKRKKLI